MKKTILTLSMAVGLITWSSFAFADDDHKQGGSVKGVENLQVNAAFVATSDAPVGSGGGLRIRSKTRDDVSVAGIKIKTRGLPDGAYNVSATLKSDGSTVDLGQITLAPEEAEDDDDNAVNVSESKVELPSGVSAMDLATVTISDTSAVALLVADLVNAPGKSLVVFNSRVRVQSDDAKVKGTAVFHAYAHNGKQKGNFVMTVHGLPSQTILHLVVNETEIGTVTTNRNGAVLVKKLTGQVLSLVNSVALKDDEGNILAQANF
jgi:hypothetical protein